MKILKYNLTRKDFVPPLLLKVLGRDRQQTLKYYYHDALRSHSQYNEDLIIDAILKCKEKGIYVDVGANHPDQLSNTKRFYDRGWHGINIEPNPRAYEVFRTKRERDINLNIGVGEKRGVCPFYSMSINTLSSFDKESALKSGKHYNAKLEEVLEIPVVPLKEVFKEHLDDSHVDFMSIDTEGYDMNVLLSNDWASYRPSLIMIETGETKDFISKFLADNGYVMVFDNFTNAIYMEKDFPLFKAV